MFTPGPVMSYGGSNAFSLSLSLRINTGYRQPAFQAFSCISFPAK
ncbi:Uncharacterised protein [Shigella sonnei]|nr:Uncharacterised protein [Shigella sonnei]